jgi:hypothetical protein
MVRNSWDLGWRIQSCGFGIGEWALGHEKEWMVHQYTVVLGNKTCWYYAGQAKSNMDTGEVDYCTIQSHTGAMVASAVQLPLQAFLASRIVLVRMGSSLCDPWLNYEDCVGSSQFVDLPN